MTKKVTDNTILLGADIGGSHITTALIDVETRQVLPASLKRARVNPSGSVTEIIDSWASSLKASIGEHSILDIQIGIAIPGPFDYENGISLMKDNHKYEALYQVNAKQLLSDILGISANNITMSNDASCFIKGEMVAGVARQYNSTIAVVLGTGLGTSKYSNGLAEDAALWEMPFRDGIAEDYLSTRALVNRYFELTGQKVTGVKDISDRFYSEIAAKQVFEEFGKTLGEFLIEFMKTDTPEAIIIGGNIAQSLDKFLPPIEALFAQKKITTKILQAALGEHAPIIGACSFAWQ